MSAPGPLVPEFPLDSTTLAMYSKFALKGGIGNALANEDRMAEDSSQLMFFKGDSITVLMDLGKREYLGFCEGIVGKFSSEQVTFTTKLKRAVLSPKPSPETYRAQHNPTASTSSALSKLSPSPSSPARKSALARSDPISPTQFKPSASSSASATSALSPPPPTLVKPELEPETELTPGPRAQLDLSASGASARNRRRKTAVSGLDLDGGGALGGPRMMLGNGPTGWTEEPMPRLRTPDLAVAQMSTVPPSPAGSNLDATPSLVMSPDSNFGDTVHAHEALTPVAPGWDTHDAVEVETISDFTPVGLGLGTSLVREEAQVEMKPKHERSASLATLSSSTSLNNIASSPQRPVRYSTSIAPNSAEAGVLRSKWSEASLAESYRRTGKFSEEPSVEDMPKNHSLYGGWAAAAAAETREGKSSSDSRTTIASRDSQASGFGSGDDTEMFAALYDSYRYSSATPSDGGSMASSVRNSVIASSPELSPVKHRVANTERLRREMGHAVPEVEEEDEGDGEPEDAPLDYAVSPARPNAHNLASELRERLKNSGGDPSPPFQPRPAQQRPMLPPSSSTESFIQRIPRLSTLFPRSTTDDSLASISPSPSLVSVDPESPVKRRASHGLPRRNHFSPNVTARARARTASADLVGAAVAEEEMPTPTAIPTMELPVSGSSSSSSIQTLAHAMNEAIRPHSPPKPHSRPRTQSADEAGHRGGRIIQPVLFSPTRQSSLPQSRALLRLGESPPSSIENADSPLSTSPRPSIDSASDGVSAPELPSTAPLTITRPQRKSSAKGLTLTRPALGEPPMPAWRSATTNSPVHNSPKQVDDVFSSPTPTPTSATFPLPTGLAASLKSPTSSISSVPSLGPALVPGGRDWYDDPDAEDHQFKSRMPKLTIPNDGTGPKTGFEFALRVPPSPSAPGPLASPSTVAGSMSLSSSLSSQQKTSFELYQHPILRSKSVTSLADSPRSARLQKASLKVKTAHSSSIDESADSQSLTRSPSSLSSPRAAKAMASKPSSSKLFSRSKAADKDGKPRMTGISNRDFMDETVVVGKEKVEFEMIKPLKLELLKDGTHATSPVSHEQSRSDSFGSRPSFANDSFAAESEVEFDTPKRVTGGLTPYGQSKLATSLSTASLGHYSPPPVFADEHSAAVHRERELKWIQVLSAMTPAAAKGSKKVKHLIAAGIPSSVRGKVWSFLSEADSIKVDGLYHQLTAMDRAPIDDQIEQDVAGAFVDHPEFAEGSANRVDMFEMLKAVNRHEPELGFGRGMAFIAGLLLTQNPAENAFWILIALVNGAGFSNYFHSRQDALRTEMVAFRFMLEATHPKIAKRLAELKVDVASFYPLWCSTLFVSCLPWATVLRIADGQMLDDKFKLKAALALLDLSSLLDQDRFPTRDSIEHFLHKLPEQGFGPSLAIPAALNTKVKDSLVRKCTQKAQKELGVQGTLTRSITWG